MLGLEAGNNNVTYKRSLERWKESIETENENETCNHPEQETNNKI